MFKLANMAEIQLTGDNWQRLRSLVKRQKFLGNLACIFLAIALIAMMDGLIAGMREGSNRLDILPGQHLAISGPAATKNPLPSDVIARFTPEDCPLRFHLEGFFTGYWFGSGMWRALVEAPDNYSDMTCALTVTFRGMPAKSAQRYDIHLFANENASLAASFSIFKRFLSLNPFSLACVCALGGIVSGVLTYIYGRVYLGKIRENGLLTVYSIERDNHIFTCAGPQSAFNAQSEDYAVFSENGERIGAARAIEWKKGKWRMKMNNIPPAGALVETRHFIRR